MEMFFLPILTILVTNVASAFSSDPPKCEWGIKWNGSVSDIESPCKARLKLAFVQEMNGTYQAKCCWDKESVKNERKFAQQCNTTACLVTPEEKRSPCDTLPSKLYIRGKELRYEAGVEEDCKDPKTKRKGIAVVCCPKKSLDRLLLSAQAAEENEFPHMCSTDGCGCTVYNKEWLITAAHCHVNETTGEIRNLERKPLNVLLGSNLNNLNSTIHSFPVGKIIVHPEFSLLKGNPERNKKIKRIYNDIALLKLKRKINFQKSEPYIKALPLAPVNFRPEIYSNKVIILGWGTTGFGTGSQHLKKANLLLRDKDVCFHEKTGRFSYASEFKRQFLCLGGIVNGSASGSAGGGDSGGPAICQNQNGEAVLCGVSSFGADIDEDECGELQTEEVCFPSAYDDIGYFRQWIDDNVSVGQDERELYKVKLYGDVDISREEFLHQVHITTEDGQSCGGTLVDLETVVSAAHCLVRDDGKQRRGIRIATFVKDLNRRVNETNVYRTRRRGGVHYHRNFSRVTELDALQFGKSDRVLFLDSPYAFDIAIVKLERKVIGISRENLPALPRSKRFEPGPAVEIALPLDTSRSGKLMKRDYNILPKKECKTRFKRFKLIGIETQFDANEVICGVEKYSGGSTCDRELGGGLICEGNLFCGIQTFRTCHMTIPNGFLSVAIYAEWIRNFLN